MLPLLLTVMIALVQSVTSRTDLSLNFKNLQNSAPLPMRLNNFVHRPDFDQPEKFGPDASELAGQFNPQDLAEFSSAMKYQEPFKKLSIVEELNGNTDEIIPLIEASDDDNDNDQLSIFLTQLLQEPGVWEAPLVLVEEPITWEASVANAAAAAAAADNSIDSGSDTISNAPWKRSRYYRRYPWKRQNSRNRYDDSSRYLCTPTREDVFQLLRALHDAHQGNKSKTVNFCNRRRPAGAIFTNIRFLGRRK